MVSHVYPACAGIDLIDECCHVVRTGLPRMRGDRPRRRLSKQGGQPFTPHARGSTLPLWSIGRIVIVYPACAGIDPRIYVRLVRGGSLPRMRGDRPLPLQRREVREKFTPHARGSTPVPDPCSTIYMVYPACAGIDPLARRGSSHFFRLPRMRGDRPLTLRLRSRLHQFTPHARGSTCIRYRPSVDRPVYPACAGIDLSMPSRDRDPSCLPRMRGDRPGEGSSLSKKGGFTPHARGSTCHLCRTGLHIPVYPACAGIDLVIETVEEVN